VLSGRGICDELITLSEESYRLWRFVVCDLETSKKEAKSPLKGREYKPTVGCDAEREKKITSSISFTTFTSIWLLQLDQSKPPYSAPFLSSFPIFFTFQSLHASSSHLILSPSAPH
jgi:hypothetical protein